MCRLFGMAGGEQPVKATFWLEQAPDSLAAQSHREPDGTGIGYYSADGAPHVEKSALAAYEDKRFLEEAREVESRTFVAHVRFASTGALVLRNTHPFEQDRRLFAHNGVIEGLDALDAELGSYRRLVRGETDSERFFALITQRANERDGDVGAAITDAARWIAQNLPVFALNLILTTAAEVWALRYPDTHELYVLERPGGAQMQGASALTPLRVRSAHLAGRPAVVLASERMDDDPGWRLLDPGELLHVAADLSVDSRVALEAAPRHQLRLSDLEGQGAASQLP